MTKNRVQTQGLGPALKASRKLAKLTQYALADLAGIHRNALLAVEAKRGSLATLNLIAAALGLEVSGRGLAGDGTLGQRLQALRKRRRLSRRTAATLANVSVPSIEGIERTGAGHVATLEALGRSVGAGLCLVPIGTSVGFWESAATSSAEMEWYTPRWLLDRVAAAVGSFDCDPCSPGRGKSEVDARLHFTVKDDGLSHAWPGTVWLNPPYGAAIVQWLEKARHELASGHASKVIALIPARTDTRWWHEHAASHADIVMLKGRVAFIGGGPAPFPSALVSYGLSDAERDRLFAAFPDGWHVAVRRSENLENIFGQAAD